jgi:hypothetical protein
MGIRNQTKSIIFEIEDLKIDLKRNLKQVSEQLKKINMEANAKHGRTGKSWRLLLACLTSFPIVLMEDILVGQFVNSLIDSKCDQAQVACFLKSGHHCPHQRF